MFESLLELARTNPQVAGAMTLVIGGIIATLSRNLPKVVGSFVRSQTVSRIELDNAKSWDGTSESMQRFFVWYAINGMPGLSRSYHFNQGEVTAGSQVNHFFTYKKRLFWFKITEMDSSGIQFRKQILTISGLTRDSSLITQFMEEINYEAPSVAKKNPVVKVLQAGVLYERPQWVDAGTIKAAANIVPLVNDAAMTQIRTCIDRFKQSKDWFEENHAPYKRTMVFYGPPGTGKTTLSVQLAMMTGRSICTMNIAAFRSGEFQTLMGSIPANSILLLEDIHSCQNLLINHGEARSDASTSLTTFLNALSGVIPLDDVIIIMTTNYLERIAPEVYRAGRADLVVKVDYLTNEDVYLWLLRTYGEVAERYNDMTFPSNLTSGEVYRVYEIHRENHEEVVKELSRYAIPQTPIAMVEEATHPIH